MAYVQLWNCPGCGEVEAICLEANDVDRDDVEIIAKCAKCMNGLVRPLVKDGKPVYRALSSEVMD